MRRVVCRVSRTTLMARVLDTGAPPAVLEGHVATCLRCQAAVAQAERLRRALRTITPPAGPGHDSARPPFAWAAVAASLAAAVLMLRIRQQS